MSYKNIRQNNDSPRSKISSRFVLAATLLLTIVVILVFLFVFNVISVPEYILNVFKDNGSGDGEELGSCEISDIKTSEDLSVVYEKHYENAYEVLISLTESKIYRRSIRTIYTENNNTFVVRATIIHRNDLFRVEYPEKTLIYNGKELYIENPTYSLRRDGVYSIYDEVGLTPLSYLKENASASDVFYRNPDNKKKITIIIRDDSMSIYNEYEVSVENGLVLAERSYYNNEVYRAVITDKIEIMDHAPPAEELFIIPES